MYIYLTTYYGTYLTAPLSFSMASSPGSSASCERRCANASVSKRRYGGGAARAGGGRWVAPRLCSRQVSLDRLQFVPPDAQEACQTDSGRPHRVKRRGLRRKFMVPRRRPTTLPCAVAAGRPRHNAHVRAGSTSAASTASSARPRPCRSSASASAPTSGPGWCRFTTASPAAARGSGTSRVGLLPNLSTNYSLYCVTAN